MTTHTANEEKTIEMLERALDPRLIKQRWSMCARKKSFDNQHNAEKSNDATRNEQRAYKCPHCNGWHLTSRKT